MAEEYLNYYVGDFPYLVSARNAMAEGLEIPVQVVRGVLNCMLGDMHWSARLPTPKPMMPPDFSKPFDPPWPGPTRPTIGRIPLKVKWRLPYGVVNAKAAKAVHLLDQNRSQLTYKTTVHMDETESSEYEWQIYWVCRSRSVNLFESPAGKLVLLSVGQAASTVHQGVLAMGRSARRAAPFNGTLFRDWRYCRQCQLHNRNGTAGG
jgi:hypothetical protein